jgi:hypothetical protein
MRKTPPSHGIQVFPSPTGGTRRRLKIGITPYLRCIQCGFANDTRKTTWSKQGEGIDPVTQEVKAGCKFCGSLFWQEQKPPKIADDRFKANPSVKVRK